MAIRPDQIKMKKPKKKTDIERLENQISSLKKNLKNCKTEDSRNRSELNILAMTRKLEIAKKNKKTKLSIQCIRPLQGGAPGLGKRKS